MKYNILADYVADLQTKGRYTFTRDEVQKALPLTGLALKKSLERLAKKGSIVLVHRGFYVVVPLEYRKKEERDVVQNNQIQLWAGRNQDIKMTTGILVTPYQQSGIGSYFLGKRAILYS